METKQAFVVGRRTRRGTVVVLVRDGRPPIQGPFTLRAVITPATPEGAGEST
jgi:hypothetical protein